MRLINYPSTQSCVSCHSFQSIKPRHFQGLLDIGLSFQVDPGGSCRATQVQPGVILGGNSLVSWTVQCRSHSILPLTSRSSVAVWPHVLMGGGAVSPNPSLCFQVDPTPFLALRLSQQQSWFSPVHHSHTSRNPFACSRRFVCPHQGAGLCRSPGVSARAREGAGNVDLSGL